MVTPRVASPDRSNFAKLGETIAASLVQAQEHTNYASVQLDQTKQLADDIRSQVASRELAEMNEWLMVFDCPRWGLASGYVGRSVSVLLMERRQA